MSSASMPPPPSPLAHRRTRFNLYQDKPSSCLPPHKMSLSKGATFHQASSPPTDADPVLSIPHLTRRSPTCSHATLLNFLSEKREIAAQNIADFEETFSGARGNTLSRRRRSAQDFQQQLKQVRAALPTDEGLGSSIGSPASDKGLSQGLAGVDLASNKDSGLGESIEGSVQNILVPVTTSADNNLVVADLVQDTDYSDNTQSQPPRTGSALGRSLITSTTSDASHLPSSRASSHPQLSRFAHRKIVELLVQPILREEKYKDFHPLVNHLTRRTSKNVRCLRDIERSLFFQPLVSQLYPRYKHGSNTQSKARGFSVSPSLYRSFGELTVQLTLDTFPHLSESDQRRATDQPYTAGYFLDLVQQVERLASHIGSSSRSETEEIDEDAPSADDEITLEGGLGVSGDLAELVRWRNGKGISLRTGLPYEPLPGIKRQHSTMTDEEIARSMARRKKGYIPEIVEMKCSDPDCDKIFTRKCDLAKHEKTHSRPFKCPHVNCKYHELGLPTEKEKERHVNDKHDPNPKLYRCKFCEFRTKRESNCKQHMEKKHNWEYKRAKGKDKDISGTPSATPSTPAIEYSPQVIQPSPAQMTYVGGFDDASSMSGSVAESAQFTPYDEPVNEFGYNPYANHALFPQAQQPQANQFVQGNTNLGFEAPVYNNGFEQFNGYISPVSANAPTQFTPATPAWSTITGQSPYLTTHNNFNNAGLSNQVCWNGNEGLLTPESAAYQNISRHASIQFDESPIDLTMRNTSVIGNQMADVNMGLPTSDFALFGGAFSNPSAADQTLFPAGAFDSQKFSVADFERIQDVDMDMDMVDNEYELDAYVDFGDAE